MPISNNQKLTQIISSMARRKFQGSFTPAIIHAMVEAKILSVTEAWLWGEIRSFQHSNQKCWMSNAALGGRCGLSGSRTRDLIYKLIDLGLLTRRMGTHQGKPVRILRTVDPTTHFTDADVDSIPNDTEPEIEEEMEREIEEETTGILPVRKQAGCLKTDTPPVRKRTPPLSENGHQIYKGMNKYKHPPHAADAATGAGGKVIRRIPPSSKSEVRSAPPAPVTVHPSPEPATPSSYKYQKLFERKREQHYGRKMSFHKQDVAHLKWLHTQLKGSTPAFRRLVDYYLSMSDPFYDGHPASLLRSQFDKITVRMDRDQEQNSRQVSDSQQNEDRDGREAGYVVPPASRLNLVEDHRTAADWEAEQERADEKFMAELDAERAATNARIAASAQKAKRPVG